VSLASIYSQSIYNPDFQFNHPVTITPLVDAGDGNPVQRIPGQGGVVDQKITERVRLAWARVVGAVSYILYGSISPFRQQNILEEGITGLFTDFDIPVFTQSLEYYFWVAWVDKDGVVTYLTDDPATLATRLAQDAFHPNPLTPDCRWVMDVDQLNCEIEQDLQYIRAGHRLQLEMGAEKGLLYKRRHGEDKPWGIPCTCTTQDLTDDPDYSGNTRCKLCFGTGVFGGFYPAIPILFRYENVPDNTYKPTAHGLELVHAFNSWTLWEPFIGQDDILVRLSDGTRFRVTGRRESSLRGIKLHQQMDLAPIEKTDVRQDVTNAAIDKALSTAKNPLYSVTRFKVFG
jgi:hypothetical protein